MTTLLRAVLVGVGMMGRNHARILQTLDDVQLVAVIDESVADAQSVGVERVLRSIEDLDPALADFAVIATPTSSHENTATRLIGMGLHVLVEKPISHSSEAGRRMAERTSGGHIVGAVGHIERYNPALRELKKRLRLGEIGEVYQIATRRQGSFPRRIEDVGVTKDLASHDIDLTAWIADSSYEVVFGQVAHKSGRQHEDMISVTGKLSNGVIVNHIVNWLSPMKERIVTVTGDKGTFVADTLTGDLTLHENGAFAVEWDSFAAFRGVTEGNVTRFAFPKMEPLRVELEEFCRAVRGDNQAEIVSFAEGVEVVRVAEAIVESSRIVEPVRLSFH